MDSELLYLTKRASFHRRLVRAAACGEAGSAHQAFVVAYQRRIDDWAGPIRAGRSEQDSAPDAVAHRGRVRGSESPDRFPLRFRRRRRTVLQARRQSS